MRRHLPLLLKAAVSVGLLVVILSGMDLEAVARRLAGARAEWLVAALLAMLLQVPLAALRWRVALGALGAPLRARRVLAITYAGLFFNQALPSSVGGDAVRMWQARRDGLSRREAVHGVLLERVGMVMTLALLVALGQPLLLPQLDGTTAALLFRGVALAGGASMAVLLLLVSLALVGLTLLLGGGREGAT